MTTSIVETMLVIAMNPVGQGVELILSNTASLLKSGRSRY